MEDEHAPVARPVYEPPALVWLGPLTERTEISPGGPPIDGPFGPASSSDRALKEGFAPVDTAAILAGVRALPIYRRG